MALVAVLSVAISGTAASVAAADVPPCTGRASSSVLYSGLGKLESVATGNGGRIYVSLTPEDSTASRLITIRRPGGTPRTVADGPGGPGGLAWAKRRLLWGYGNTAEAGETGDENPVAGLYRVNLKTGSKSVISDRLGMANGVVRAKNGAIYASNDFGMKLDRITPSGTTVNGWATVESANGLVLSKNQKYLFAAQTFAEPSAISRIRISDPGTVETWAGTEGLITGNPIFDGLTRDNKGNLYVAAWAAGEIWKVDSKRRFCVVATDLGRPSALVFGKSEKGFRSGRLYTVGFNGELAEIKGAVAATYPSG
jgi:sugar lactone lactonase YvrE